MDDRVALVTGGSRGIGRAICLALARSGHHIAVNFRSDGDAAKETLDLVHGDGREGIVVQGDVGDAAQIEAMFGEVEEALGPVSVLVNNAGVRRDGLAMAMSDDDWLDVIGANLYGPFATSRRALRAMVRNRFGRIVNVSSIAGLRGVPGQANYCASKAGLIGLTKALAREVAKANITVNAIAPGLVETELTTSLPPDRYAQIVKDIPAGRAGTPDEIAATVSFLCSDGAAYVNGMVFVADGAMTA